MAVEINRGMVVSKIENHKFPYLYNQFLCYYETHISGITQRLDKISEGSLKSLLQFKKKMTMHKDWSSQYFIHLFWIISFRLSAHFPSSSLVYLTSNRTCSSKRSQNSPVAPQPQYSETARYTASPESACASSGRSGRTLHKRKAQRHRQWAVHQGTWQRADPQHHPSLGSLDRGTKALPVVSRWTATPAYGLSPGSLWTGTGPLRLMYLVSKDSNGWIHCIIRPPPVTLTILFS